MQIEEDVVDGVKADEKDNKLRDLSNSINVLLFI